MWPEDILADSSPAVLLQNLRLIGAVEELALEELHSDYSEDEHEEDVDDEDVQDVLQRVHNTVKHCLEWKNRADGRLKENSRFVGTTLQRIKSWKNPLWGTVRNLARGRLSLSAASSLNSSHDMPYGAHGKYLADIQVQHEVTLSCSWSAEHWQGVLSLLCATSVAATPLWVRGPRMSVCLPALIILNHPFYDAHLIFQFASGSSAAFMRLTAQEETAEACLSPVCLFTQNILGNISGLASSK